MGSIKLGDARPPTLGSPRAARAMGWRTGQEKRLQLVVVLSVVVLRLERAHEAQYDEIEATVAACVRDLVRQVEQQAVKPRRRQRPGGEERDTPPPTVMMMPTCACGRACGVDECVGSLVSYAFDVEVS